MDKGTSAKKMLMN